MTVEGDTPAARATSARVAAIRSSLRKIQPTGAVGRQDDGFRSICPAPIGRMPRDDERPAGVLDRHRMLSGVEDDAGHSVAQEKDSGL